MKMNKEHNIFVTMGASNHTEEEREKNEFYATNPIFINHLLEREPWLKDKDLKILEPSAGDGTLVDRFYELTGNKMDAYDIISRRDDIIEQNYFTKNFSDQYDVSSKQTQIPSPAYHLVFHQSLLFLLDIQINLININCILLQNDSLEKLLMSFFLVYWLHINQHLLI